MLNDYLQNKRCIALQSLCIQKKGGDHREVKANFSDKIGQMVCALLTFNPKGGSLGRLSETGEGVELQVGRQGLDEANGHCAFTFTKWGGSYTKHK